MKAILYLPFVIAVGLAACEKKTAEAPPAQAPAPAPAASAPAPTPAPETAQAPASASTPTPAPEAPAASAPAATPPTQAATAGAGDLAKGEQVYNTSCVACHGAAVMGAPKLGDKAAWGPRIAKGKDVLYTSAIKGLNLMPPKGGNAGLKDEDLKAAVDFMISKSS